MKPKVVAIIPARSDSSRLPGKHLREVGGQPMIYYLVDRLLGMPQVDEVVVATTARKEDENLAQVSRELGAQVYKGSLEDVTGRFAGAARAFGAEIVVKANGDNPLQAPEVISAGINQLIKQGVDLKTGRHAYTGLPVGVGAEVLSREAVEWLDSKTPELFREDSTRYAFEAEGKLIWAPIDVPGEWKGSEQSITVDTMDDLVFFARVVSLLPKDPPREWPIEVILKAMKEAKNYE